MPETTHPAPVAAATRPHLLLQRPRLLLLVLVAIVLGFFFTKPLHMDDPLFVWAGQQIAGHPGDPYGFDVNWDDATRPMWQVTQNPPLVCYFIAVAGSLSGWNEAGLHAFFLLPAGLAILGIYQLAQKFCRRPLFAALATLFTPGFLSSGTSLMCDTAMLGLWVWAVYFWIDGVERNEPKRLGLAGVLMALAPLSKYFGLCLVPMLIVYTVLEKKRPRCWFGYFLIPVVTLLGYGFWTQHQYGQNLLFGAGRYASQTRAQLGLPGASTALTALAFTGGSLGSVVFLAPWLARKRTLGAIAALALGATLLLGTSILKKYHFLERSSFPLLIQMAVWSGGGILILFLAGRQVLEQRDPGSWLLLLWILGTFAFAAFVNWTINIRSILPLLPAAAILLARRLEGHDGESQASAGPGMLAAAAAGGALAVGVAWADFSTASATRQVVEDFRDRFPPETRTGSTWFYGHWGFQYYMQLMGAKPVGPDTVFQPGDWFLLPDHNPTTLPAKPGPALTRGEVVQRGPGWITTMNDAAGAGGYGSFWGPLPFAFGPVPPERVAIGVVAAQPINAGPIQK